MRVTGQIFYGNVRRGQILCSLQVFNELIAFMNIFNMWVVVFMNV